MFYFLCKIENINCIVNT